MKFDLTYIYIYITECTRNVLDLYYLMFSV